MKNKFKTVVLGIVENKDKILMTQRLDPKIRQANLKWDIIGGTQKPQENLEDTLIREALEETGYQIKILNKLKKEIERNWHHDEFELTVHLHCFHCCLNSDIVNQEISKDKKINKIVWIN